MKPQTLLLLLLLTPDRTLIAEIKDELPPCSDDGLSCSIHVDEGKFNAGDPLFVEVTCKNASDDRIRLEKLLSFRHGTVWCEIKRPDAAGFETVLTGMTGISCTEYLHPLYLDPRSSVVCRALFAVGKVGRDSESQFILDCPGTYQLRARITHSEGRCYSEPVTFRVKPASEKMATYISALANKEDPETKVRESELDKLFGQLSALSPSGGAGLGTEKDLQRMRKHLGDQEGYQVPLLMGEAWLLLYYSRDPKKHEEGFAKLDSLLHRRDLRGSWKQVATEMKALHLARLDRDAEAQSILKNIGHESELTRTTRANLPGGGREVKATSTQPAPSAAQGG